MADYSVLFQGAGQLQEEGYSTCYRSVRGTLSISQFGGGGGGGGGRGGDSLHQSVEGGGDE